MNRQLSGDPKRIINEIRNRIPETASENSFIPNQATRLIAPDGNFLYGGAVLTGKVGELVDCLVEDMSIEKRDWGWSIWHFPNGKTINNPNSAMYLIPLSDEQGMTSDGILGDISFTANSATFNPRTTVLIFMK